eukprot:c38940_g1_i1.p1 GENE.c38940_g1_i1~~c38940_g1_i1.p1  ORF type:complete len:173 (+),score=41.52 c38940_g1_i1:29-547(+)
MQVASWLRTGVVTSVRSFASHRTPLLVRTNGTVLHQYKVIEKEKLEDLTKPHLVDGRWRKPKVNNRRLNEFRKRCIVAGVECPIPKPEAKPIRGHTFKKGKKFMRDREKRQAKIASQMAQMEELIKARKKLLKEAKKSTGLEAQFEALLTKPKPKYGLADLAKDLDALNTGN